MTVNSELNAESKESHSNMLNTTGNTDVSVNKKHDTLSI